MTAMQRLAAGAMLIELTQSLGRGAASSPVSLSLSLHTCGNICVFVQRTFSLVLRIMRSHKAQSDKLICCTLR